MVAQNLLLLHVPVSPVWINLCVPAILHQWLRLSLVQPGVDVPNQKEQSMSYNKQETPKAKKSKKKKNNDDSSSSSSSSSSYHILSLFKSPWPPWAPVKNNPTKHGIWAMDDIVGGLIFLPIISLAWRRRFICDLQLDPVASSPRPGHCFSSNGTNF